MLKISLSQQAIKFLKKIPLKHAQQIEKTLRILKQCPLPHDSKKIKGSGEYYRVNTGEYRVIYRIDSANQLIIIAIIGKRNDGDVYKQFKRK